MNANTGLPYVVYVNRPLGKWLAQRLLFLTPNQVSLIGLCVFFAGAAVSIFLANTYYALLVTPIYMLHYALDSADGNVARIQGSGSKVGEWLDHSIDGIRYVILHVAILWALLLNNPDSYELLALVGFTVNIIAMCGNYIFNALKATVIGRNTGEILNELNPRRALVLRLLATPADLGVYFFLMIALVRIDVFVWLYLAYGIYFSLIFTYTIVSTLRQPSS